MRAALLLLLVLLVAGCSAPTDEPAPSGPIDLPEAVGTYLIDLRDRDVQLVSATPGVAWMSDSGRFVTWTETNRATVLDRASGARVVAPAFPWSRIDDDGTGVEMVPGAARVRALATGESVRNVTLPPAPEAGAAWTAASADFGFLASERAPARAEACQHDLTLRGESTERRVGCHLHVASDGRAGWTEGSGVHVRATNGTSALIASGEVQQNGTRLEYTAYENPVFSANGTLFLRLFGSNELERTTVVNETMAPLATLDAPYKLALFDASLDGRWLLARVFEA